MTDDSCSQRRKTHLAGKTVAVLAEIGKAVLWLGYQLEHGLILTLEGLRRLGYLFDRRIYSEDLRIARVTDGLAARKSDKFALLVIYSDIPLPTFTEDLIEKLAQTSFNLVIVSNKPIAPPAANVLRGKCLLLIERNNIGRDFGAYKDGISVIFKKFGLIEKLVIANDSVFYFPDGLDRLVADLDGPQDFIGVSEVFEHHYHVASFMMSFGRKVLESSDFRRFWRNYRPIDTRRWAIHRGEGALTECLLRAGFLPHILFQAEHLRKHLKTRSLQDLGALLPLLPIEPRRELERRFADVLASGRSDQATAAESADRLADAIVEAIKRRNQMHAGGFLFQRLLGLPVIKRDIAYREIYSMSEACTILRKMETPVAQEAIADLQRRGTSARLGALDKLLWRHSAA